MKSTASKKEIKDFKLIKGDVLLTKDSEVPEEIGMPSVINENIDDLICGYHLYILRIKNSILSPEYLCWTLRSNQLRQYFYQMANGSTRFGLNLGHVSKCLIPIPPLPEQKRIAEILSKIDYLIDILELEICKLEKLKTGNFEKFIAESLEKGTEVCALSKLVKLSQGVQVDLENQTVQKGLDKIRFIRIIDYTQKDIPRYIDKPLGDKGLVNAEDVVMVRYGASAGLVCRGVDGIIANNLFIVKPLGKLTKEYIFYFLSSNRMQNEIRKLALSSAMPALNFNSINSLKILVPPINQQSKISNLMTSIDNNIELIKKKLEKIISLKISISQDLLSGRKRVEV